MLLCAPNHERGHAQHRTNETEWVGTIKNTPLWPYRGHIMTHMHANCKLYSATPTHVTHTQKQQTVQQHKISIMIDRSEIVTGLMTISGNIQLVSSDSKHDTFEIPQLNGQPLKMFISCKLCFFICTVRNREGGRHLGTWSTRTYVSKWGMRQGRVHPVNMRYVALKHGCSADADARIAIRVHVWLFCSGDLQACIR